MGIQLVATAHFDVGGKHTTWLQNYVLVIHSQPKLISPKNTIHSQESSSQNEILRSLTQLIYEKKS